MQALDLQKIDFSKEKRKIRNEMEEERYKIEEQSPPLGDVDSDKEN